MDPKSMSARIVARASAQPVKVAAEKNPTLLKMEKACEAALVSVDAALKLMQASPDKGPKGSVVPEAIKDLTKAKRALEALVGDRAPYVWNLVDPA
jgi:3-hydroxy-3-methylglutaryl CoA synthase